ncbi:MAG: hypothetical protein JWQ76_2151, partial [Ramlibacter sp.]|nr:hypothetical protein [Ramlibacter sp.]
EDREKTAERSEFMASLRWGALIGVALLLIIVPPMRMAKNRAQAPAQPPVATAPATQAPADVPAPTLAEAPTAPDTSTAGAGPAQAMQQQALAPQAVPAGLTRRAPGGVQVADFNGEDVSPEARHVANWAVYTRDYKKRAFVIVDKADARVYVFGPDGKLKDSAPALLGAARGDDSFPGIGDKPLSAVRPEEKTTPAGRFVAEPGRNSHGEDIVWVDYAAAVSMHRIRPLVAQERRLERLASRTIEDNRISFGCINLPVTFYEDVLSPTVKKYGAIVYVLPETRSAQKVFGSFDVPQGARAQQVVYQQAR